MRSRTRGRKLRHERERQERGAERKREGRLE